VRGAGEDQEGDLQVVNAPWDGSSLNLGWLVPAGRQVRHSDGDVTMQGIGPGQGFWHLLTPDHRRALSALGSAKMYKPGATICVQGDPATHVFVLVDGWVKVLSVTDEGHETVLALRGDGDVVGESSGETTGRRNATIKAITTVHALLIGFDNFNGFLDTERAADRAFRRMMTRRWTETDMLLRLRAVTVGAQRLARLLVELAGRYGAGVDGAIEIALPLSQEELASLAGTSRATVTRALKDWRKRGLIRTSQRQRHIIITNVPGLKQLAGPAI
jgi:CRP/FNR family transcriptional regulator, cyclic AMP receptor protein